MRYKPRPRQREPFGQSNHKRCVRRPYVPVDKFGRTHDHPADVATLYLHQYDPAHDKQQPYSRPRTQNQDPSRPSHIWCGLQQWVCPLSGTDYSEPSTASSYRLSHCGRRMSLFLLMLVLRGVCSIPANQYPQEFVMSKTAITSPELAPPVGPFSQAVKIDGFLFFSGQVAQDPATGKAVEGGIVPETERVFQT